MINEHKPTAELNDNDNDNNNINSNSNNNNNNDKNSNNNNNNNSNRADWKTQLTMQTNCISTRSFEDKCTIYSKSESVEIFMGSNTKDVIDKHFNTLLRRFQKAQEISNERGSEFVPDSVELSFSKNRH